MCFVGLLCESEFVLQRQPVEHLAMMERCVGRLPEKLTSTAVGEAATWFGADFKLKWPDMMVDPAKGSDSTPVDADGVYSGLLVEAQTKVEAVRPIRDRFLGTPDFAELLTALLHPLSGSRPTAEEALQYRFFD